MPRTEAAQPAARTERKSRRRGRGGQGPETVPSTPAAVHAEPTEAERHAKAEATRAALANIAAAAHAAHLHDGEAAAASEAGARQAAVDAVTKLAATEEAAGRPATVLTFGGEQVALPFVEHAEETQAPALTLDLLTEAFANLGDAEAGKQAGTGRRARPPPLQHRRPRRRQPRKPPHRQRRALQRHRPHGQRTPRRRVAAAGAATGAPAAPRGQPTRPLWSTARQRGRLRPGRFTRPRHLPRPGRPSRPATSRSSSASACRHRSCSPPRLNNSTTGQYLGRLGCGFGPERT